MLNKAISLAIKVHEKQVDKAGEPYILHPLRVMLKMQTEEERVVAVLHDVLEDSKEVTLDDLSYFYNLPGNVMTAISALTREKGESYKNYINRVCQNPLARKVKLADLEDNLDTKRILNPTPEDKKRWKKYTEAWLTIMSYK